MAVASPAMADAMLEDQVKAHASPLASTGFAGPGVAAHMLSPRAHDQDSETLARPGPLALGIGETTRALSREELVRHQDAQLIVGNDALGDEATLAVAPGQGNAAMAAVMADVAETRKAVAANAVLHTPPFPQPPPAFPAPPVNFQKQVPSSSPQLPAAAPFPYPTQPQQPAMAQPGYPSSSQQPIVEKTGKMPAQTGYANPQAQTAAYAQPPQAPSQQAPTVPAQTNQRQPPPWMTQPSPPPTGMTGPTRFTKQVLLLAAVGFVCLAIFIIGVVLFVTTKF
jgi:hypothetical protein